MKIKVYIGVMGSGKDFMANKECDLTMAFADQLREDVWKMLGWRPKDEAEYEWFKKKSFGLPGGNMFTGRGLLQRYGTEVRRAEDDSHWVDALLAKIWQDVDLGATVGITDCRFPNEVRGLIRFCRQQSKELSDLGSEKAIDLEFVHCDYHSERYCANATHDSELLAQDVLKYFDGGDFTEYMIGKYG